MLHNQLFSFKRESWHVFSVNRVFSFPDRRQHFGFASLIKVSSVYLQPF